MKSVTKQWRRAQKGADKLRYFTLPRAISSYRLADYTTAVHARHDGEIEARGRIAVFVHWNPGTTIDPSTGRMIEALRDGGYAVLIVSNSKLTDDQLAWLRPRCWRMLERGNQGFDFGAWKDGMNHLYEEDVPIDRLILLNDSVFFSDRGLPEMVAALDRDHDLVSAFENWGEGYHVQSFTVSLSGFVATSEPFRRFWRDYMPFSNRIHAIDAGEKALSRTALKVARTSEVIYSTSSLYNAIVDAPKLRDPLIRLPIQWRGYYQASTNEKSTREWIANKIIDIVNATSPIHAGAYYFPKLLDCPLYKNDLVYRARFQFWEIENWLPELMDADIGREFLTRLRAKGDASALSPVDRRKYNIGIK